MEGKDERENSIKGEGSNETRGSENQERNIVAIKNQICNQTCEKYIRIDLLELCRERFSLVQINLIFCYCHLNPLYLLSNSF